MNPSESKNCLHIISFDIPYPANYGGVIDVFYKIKSLSECGVKIILHCFEYGREEADELREYCHKVYYYKRKKFSNPFLGSVPYIVKSRENALLLENLNKDAHPILFEGVHTTFYLSHPSLKSRLKIVRNHNIEQDYYKNLFEVETNFFKKQFFKSESKKLAKYESKLKNAEVVLGISKSDTEYLISKGINAKWVSAFHPNDYVDIKKGKGEYIFYHGNLGVPENNHAALYLVSKVFSQVGLPVLIAGNNPSYQLKKAVAGHQHIKLLSDLTQEEILENIQDAQINILVTFQATGIKLKLLNALFLGRHVVVNNPMIEKTGLENLCHISDNPTELGELLFELWGKEFSSEEIKIRKNILESKFSNAASAEKILNILSEPKTEVSERISFN